MRRCSVSMPRASKMPSHVTHAVRTNFSPIPPSPSLALVSRSLPSLHPRALGPGPGMAWQGMAGHGMAGVLLACLVRSGLGERSSGAAEHAAISPHPGLHPPSPRKTQRTSLHRAAVNGWNVPFPALRSAASEMGYPGAPTEHRRSSARARGRGADDLNGPMLLLLLLLPPSLSG